MLQDEERGSYPKTKETLLEAYTGMKGSIGLRCLSAERKKGQSASQFMTQLFRQCCQWWKDLTISQAATKFVLAATEKQLPTPCRNYVQVRVPTTIQEMSQYIESFFSERNTTRDDFRPNQLVSDGPHPSAPRTTVTTGTTTESK